MAWQVGEERGRGVLALAVGGGMWVAAGKEWRDGEAGVEIWWVGGERWFRGCGALLMGVVGLGMLGLWGGR